MSNIKKAYQAIIAHLETNSDKRVRDVLPEVIEMASAKQGGGGGVKSFHKNEAGEVVAAKCGFFGLWFPVIGEGAVEFGAKASSASGLNTMCKAGVSAWTKSNSDYKKGRDQLLTDMANPENTDVTADNLADLLQGLEDAKNARPEAPGVGYETLEECAAAMGIELA